MPWGNEACVPRLMNPCSRAPDPKHKNRPQWEAWVPQLDSSSPSSPPLEKAQSTQDPVCQNTDLA